MNGGARSNSRRGGLSSAAEEVLERIFVNIEARRGELGDPVELELVARTDEERAAMEELARRGLVTSEDGRARLTSAGEAESRAVIRRHRLAERLLTDVLDIAPEVMDQTACAFEHVLKPGVEEKVCTLLGHPKVCPHNLPIPPGHCCRAGRRETAPAVAPLADLKAGQEGEIAYIHSGDSAKLAKLMAMGVLPGERIRLMRRTPSFVFEVGYTQYAVDASMAADVYVRIEGAEPGAGGRGRWRWGRR